MCDVGKQLHSLDCVAVRPLHLGQIARWIFSAEQLSQKQGNPSPHKQLNSRRLYTLRVPYMHFWCSLNIWKREVFSRLHLFYISRCFSPATGNQLIRACGSAEGGLTFSHFCDSTSAVDHFVLRTVSTLFVSWSLLSFKWRTGNAADSGVGKKFKQWDKALSLTHRQAKEQRYPVQEAHDKLLSARL